MNDNDLKVIQGIRNAVETRGEDWVYPIGEPGWFNDNGDCVNLLPNGDPACIIGFIAVDQGLPTTRNSDASVDAEEWGVSWEISIAMGAAQTTQDAGRTWGDARDAFFGELDSIAYDYPKGA